MGIVEKLFNGLEKILDPTNTLNATKLHAEQN